MWLIVIAGIVGKSIAGEGLRLPQEHPVERVAFGSCAKQWEPQPIWNAIAAQQPDVFVFAGDAIYGDWHGDKPFTPTRESLQADWGRLAAIPEFAAFNEQVPVLGTWDNHDYGTHTGGAEFPLKKMSKEVFLDFFGEPANSERRKSPGIYDAKIFGPEGRSVQLILLDTRYFKGPFVKDLRSKEEKARLGVVGKYLPNDDPSVTLLGDAQWQWLEQQLQKPADIRLIFSGTQVIPDQKGMDEWGNYPHEREKLFEVIRKTEANGVVLLTGNVHFAELSRLGSGAYPLYELTSSGMTHTDTRYANVKNAYRVAGPFVEQNFGLVEIDWEARPSPLISLKALSASGDTGFTHEIALATLQPTKTERCTDPRPQMCTMDYRPVCATKTDGSHASYSNGCSACSDPAVLEHREGACEAIQR